MSEAETIPEGFELRAASVEDSAALAELFNAVCVAEIGRPWTTSEEMRDTLTSPTRDRRLEDLLLVERAGPVAGSVQFSVTNDPLEVDMTVLVRPDLWGRGLSGWLLRVGEARLRAWLGEARPDRPALLFVARFSDNEPAGRLFASHAYRYVRTFWMMEIELDRAIPTPMPPDGTRIRTFQPGRDEGPVHAALVEGFADHWRAGFPPIEEWRHRAIDGEGSGFDPSLWFVAVDGHEIVGVACCRASTPTSEDTAHVDDLAVRRAWRRRGIGRALLLTAFGEFHRRGIRRAELGVDAENPTGATRLYERAGMRTAYAWEFWEKELAPPDLGA